MTCLLLQLGAARYCTLQHGTDYHLVLQAANVLGCYLNNLCKDD